MGQRHQLFVIAKVANRYRGLAAFHHQWLFGLEALTPCLNLLAIFSAPVNRLPIRQELTAASRFDEDFWAKPQDWETSEVPFPFITTCLLLGASFDLKEGYQPTVKRLPFNMPFDGGDNNDGITVIDVSNLTDVRYCFVIWGADERDLYYRRGGREVDEGEEDENQVTGQGSVPQMTPLSGLQYLSAYLNAEERSEQAEFHTLMERYDALDLIDVSSLADTWPEGKWLAIDRETVVDADISQTSRPVQSLRKSALARLVDTSLQSTQPESSWIAEAELLPDFLPAIKARVYSEPTLLASPTAKALFLKAIEHEEELDLSPFQDLCIEDFLSITSRLPKGTNSLSLPGNVTTGLLAMLAENTTLRRIFMLDAPNLELQSAFRVMYQHSKHKVASIYHADMFRAPLQYQTFSFGGPPLKVEQCPIGDTADLLAEVGERFPVVQIFWLSRCVTSSVNVSRLDDGGLPWSTLLPPDDPITHSRHHETSVAAFPLNDAFLPINRLVNGLANFVQCLARLLDDYSGIGINEGTIAMLAAKCFALAASDSDSDHSEQVEVNPLPKQLYCSAREMAVTSRGPPAPEVQALKPVAHDGLATVAAGGRGDVVIADMKTFLKQVMNDDDDDDDDDTAAQAGRLSAHWTEVTDGIVDEFGVCGKDEVASVLDVWPKYSMRREARLKEWQRRTGRWTSATETRARR